MVEQYKNIRSWLEFTIQNVSIKSQMFFINVSRTILFTIQNVSIKLMKEQFAIATDKHLQYKMFLLNSSFILSTLPCKNVYNTKCFY